MADNSHIREALAELGEALITNLVIRPLESLSPKDHQKFLDEHCRKPVADPLTFAKQWFTKPK